MCSLPRLRQSYHHYHHHQIYNSTTRNPQSIVPRMVLVMELDSLFARKFALRIRRVGEQLF